MKSRFIVRINHVESLPQVWDFWYLLTIYWAGGLSCRRHNRRRHFTQHTVRWAPRYTPYAHYFIQSSLLIIKHCDDLHFRTERIGVRIEETSLLSTVSNWWKVFEPERSMACVLRPGHASESLGRLMKPQIPGSASEVLIGV